jgi:hypothetical protein
MNNTKKLNIRYILIGFILVVLGAVVPLAIVIGVIPNSYLLNLFAYSASIFGLFLGLFGTIYTSMEDLDK